MTLADMLAAHNAQQHNTGSTILPEVQVMRLKEIAAKYVAPCPFKNGDIVTPVRDSTVYARGKPHVVLEVRERPTPQFHLAAELGDTHSGCQADMRVANISYQDNLIAVYWTESWMFELYDPAVHEKQE